MRVLQIGKFYPIRGGVEKVMRDLTEGLSAAGVQCDMLCASLRGTEPDECDRGKSFRDGKALVIRLNEHGRIISVPALALVAATMISPALVFRMRRMLRDAEKEGRPYDIVHVHHPDPMAAVALLCSGYKGKVALHWHSDILKQKGLLRLYLPVQKWLVRRSDVIVGTTPVYVKDSPFLQDVQEKATYLPIGVHPIDPDCSAKVSEIRQRYGDRIVYSLGRLVGYKGFCHLIEAARYMDEGCHVLIGGDGPLREELQRQIDTSGLSRKVTLLGRVPEEDMAAYFNACDVFVLSSIWKTEAFAIVQIEAMSCSKPVVATRIPGSGVSWVNCDGVSGINVPPGDAATIADAVNSILSDREVYMKYSESAHRRYLEMFSYGKMIEGCMGIYKNLLGNET